MPIYHRLGETPHKRHSVFRQPDGNLYVEELMGNKGFTGPSSLLYHIHQPTQIKGLRYLMDLKWEADPAPTAQLRHFRTAGLPPTRSAILDRIPLLFNNDVGALYAQPQAEDDFFYRNGQGDELIYVSDGEGTLETQFGDLPFRRGDYLVMPRGVIHRYHYKAQPVRFLILESTGYIRTPKQYRNEHGQLTEMSPYSERDMRRPEKLVPRAEKGDFRVLVKKGNAMLETILDHHPFDVVGWDGYYYPWAINIEDFEPRVGRFHLPPPVHQMFESDGFVVCSFCPRPFDFDPQAVPVPYNHSNVMSDEAIYYASAEFMSRKNIEYGSLTLHPDGFSHGPHPGKAEESLHQDETRELAVMFDTFHPLHVAKPALAVEDRDYYRSWVVS